MLVVFFVRPATPLQLPVIVLSRVLAVYSDLSIIAALICPVKITFGVLRCRMVGHAQTCVADIWKLMQAEVCLIKTVFEFVKHRGSLCKSDAELRSDVLSTAAAAVSNSVAAGTNCSAAELLSYCR